MEDNIKIDRSRFLSNHSRKGKVRTFSIIEDKSIQYENMRLMKRISEIDRRASPFRKKSREKDFLTLQLKSRKAYRVQK